MTSDALLVRLVGVRRTGEGRWIARCPAHEDRNPSLSIRELEDGRVLVHCFAGCSVERIVAAVGIRLADLFPERTPTSDHVRGERHPWLPCDAFAIARAEIGVIVVIASDMHGEKSIDEAVYQRLLAAAEKLDEIARLAYGR